MPLTVTAACAAWQDGIRGGLTLSRAAWQDSMRGQYSCFHRAWQDSMRGQHSCCHRAWSAPSKLGRTSGAAPAGAPRPGRASDSCCFRGLASQRATENNSQLAKVVALEQGALLVQPWQVLPGQAVQVEEDELQADVAAQQALLQAPRWPQRAQGKACRPQNEQVRTRPSGRAFPASALTGRSCDPPR